jgi:TonB family protein
MQRMQRYEHEDAARRAALRGVWALALAFACGCGRGHEAAVQRPERAMPIEVRADSAERLGMPAAPARADADPGVAAARASLTLTHVASSRAALEAALPEPAPAEPPTPAPPASDALPTDDALHAPVPIAPAQLHLANAGAGLVDVDLHVDEAGEVSEVRVAFSSGDAALVPAAIDAASAMHFHPATRRGKNIAVWCRQRFVIEP